MSPPNWDPEEMTEDDREQQAIAKQEAMEALEAGKDETAVTKFSEAIRLGTDSALLYCRRAQLLLKMEMIDYCIKDCDAALELNANSAKALKIRGRAYVAQKKWFEAHKDLTAGQAMDFDEDTDEYMKKTVQVETKDPITDAPTGTLGLDEYVKKTNIEGNLAKAEAERAEALRVTQENKRKYEEGLKAREGEERAKRLAEAAEQEKEKEERRKRMKKREEDAAKKEEAALKRRREELDRETREALKEELAQAKADQAKKA